MAQLIPVELGGQTIWVEAAESAPLPGQSAIQEAKGPSDAAKKAVDTAAQFTSSIRAFCAEVVDSFTSLEERARPTKTTVEFGINVSVEGNVYVVKAGGEASVKVVAEWDLGDKRPAQ